MKDNIKTLIIGGACIAIIAVFLITRRVGGKDQKLELDKAQPELVVSVAKEVAKPVESQKKVDRASSVVLPVANKKENLMEVAKSKADSTSLAKSENAESPKEDSGASETATENGEAKSAAPSSDDDDAKMIADLTKKWEAKIHSMQMRGEVPLKSISGDMPESWCVGAYNMYSFKMGPKRKYDAPKNATNFSDHKSLKPYGLDQFPVVCCPLETDRTDPPKLSEKGSFSFIWLPDPQQYSARAVNCGIFDIMTSWCARMAKPLNVKAVLCTGDLVFQNNLVSTRKGVDSDLNSREQWKMVSRAFERLDNVVPYVLCTGNHDHGFYYGENRRTNFPDYFYPERNLRNKEVLMEVFPDFSGRSSMENAAYEFKDCGAWGDILVITLEFAPRDAAVQWAKELVEKYKDHKIIVMTHSYMDEMGRIMHFERAPYEFIDKKGSTANCGAAIFEKLIKPSQNIAMVLCGHMGERDQCFQKSVSRRTDKRADGKNVFQCFFNAQMLGGGYSGNGGDGWLRILEFLPDGKTMKVYTYSPFFGISPTTKKFAWRTQDCDEFTVVLE